MSFVQAWCKQRKTLPEISSVSLASSPLKAPSRPHNIPHPRQPRRPSQHSPQLVRVRHQRGRIAFPPRADHVRAFLPVTSSTLRIISSTECPLPVPTLNWSEAPPEAAPPLPEYGPQPDRLREHNPECRC